jgi:hypothetical protein
MRYVDNAVCISVALHLTALRAIKGNVLTLWFDCKYEKRYPFPSGAKLFASIEIFFVYALAGSILTI